MIREFSLLSFPGSLEDEIRRFEGYQNREDTFQLARIDDDIKHLLNRISMAKEEKVLPDANPYVAQYISELEKELEKLSSDRIKLQKSTASEEITQVQLQLIRDQLKDFSSRIKFEPSDIQHLLIKRYIDSIVLDQSGQFKIQFHINNPGESEETEIRLLEKTVYIKLL